jgi:hypothetical protein
MNLRKFFFPVGAALLSLSLHLACVDVGEGGSTSNTALYVFDGTAVNIWDDTATLYANVISGGATSPGRTITSTVITDNLKTPAVAGVCFDITAKRLFLVDATGVVVRIERADKQNGALSSQTDIATFTLNSSQRLQASTFGQATVDPQNGTLYVTESGSSETRIWVVANPGNYGGLNQQSSAPLQALQTTIIDTFVGGPDKGGTGVAVSQGKVYAYFSGGSSVPSPSGGSSYTGARLRAGTSSTFGSQVLVGSSTTLDDSGSGGCLALDTGNNFIYVFRSNATAASLGSVAVFTIGDLTSSFDRAPSRFLGSAAGQPYLRIIAHGGNKDWLGGAAYSSQAFSNRIWLWKNPSLGGDPQALSLSSSATISGLAFDGNQ